MDKRFFIGILSLGTLLAAAMPGERLFPEPLPISGFTFTTELGIAAWNGVPGALELSIQHDPRVFDLVDVTFTEDTPFSECIMDLRMAASGQTHMGCLQGTAPDSSFQRLATFAVMTWRVVRSIESETDIALEVTQLLNARWQSVEVHAFGQHFDFSRDTAQNEVILPTNFRLGHNYPNPFNPTTTIPYEVPERAFIRLRVYNLMGQLVTTLVSQEQPAGHYEILI